MTAARVRRGPGSHPRATGTRARVRSLTVDGGRTRARLRGDTGAGTVLVVGLVAVVVLITAALAVVGRAQVARAEAQAAADLAALAGAAAAWTPPGVRVEAATPDGCVLAREVAVRNGADAVECRQDGAQVRVVVRRHTAVGTAVGRARAGPVGAGS